MAILFHCPGCQRKLRAPEEHIGQKVKCPQCGKVFTVTPLRREEEVIEAQEIAPVRAPEPQSYSVSEEQKPATRKKADDDREPCPACGELIKPTARVCRFCGEVLEDEEEYDRPRPKRRKKRRKRSGYSDDEDMTALEWVVAILCSGIGCIVGIIYMIQGKPKGQKMFLVSLIVSLIGTAIRVVTLLLSEAAK